MKAVYIEAHGDVGVLQYGDRPDPTPGPAEVVVRVGASALKPPGHLHPGRPARAGNGSFPPPLILGKGDTAGEVVATGSEVSTLSVGDRVVVNPRLSCGVCQWCGSGRDELCRRSRFLGTAMDGSYAELVAVPEVNAYKLGGDVSFADAAAIPTTYLPVWNMAVRRAELQPWETALVFSASAGVGAAAIQVFKNVVGATVITTTSTPEKAELARSLGADHVINYNEEDITQRVREITGGAGVDLVVDHVGADVWAHGFRALRPGGRLLHLRGHQWDCARSCTWVCCSAGRLRSMAATWARGRTCGRSWRA